LHGRSQAGYVLASAEKNEIGQMFGEYFMTGMKSRVMLGSASGAMKQSPREALPVVEVNNEPSSQQEDQTGNTDYDEGDEHWVPVPNLLESGAQDRHFVAEIDNEGFAHLRFGNGELGRQPSPNSLLRATYRRGNGKAGLVGPESISHIVFRKIAVLSGIKLSARNPLPAEGGVDPEPLVEAKLFAPGTFRRDLQRAITSDDYARLAERSGSTTVQKAAASLRWAGSWYEMQVAIDPLFTEDAGQALLDEIKDSLYRYRRIGHDLAVQPARYVPLEIELTVCVLPHYLSGHVKAALQDVFSNRVLPNGKRGLFHPDNLTFGDDIYLSKLVAAAQAVEGVESVTMVKLNRFGEAPQDEIRNGVLPLSPLEVARLDSDPNFPERGKLVLNVRGGR
jgi:predicted phage baseplate assembly protein